MEVTANTTFYTTFWTALLVIGSIITYAIKMTTLKNNLEYRSATAEEKLKEHCVEIEMLKTKSNNNDIVVMEIRTKLANIETLLMKMESKTK